MAVDVSILILSWNTRELTLRCLDSLDEAVSGRLSREVIVVDNGSRDGSAESLAARTDVRLLRNVDNRGYAAGVNQAYAESEGEFVLLLNSDVRFEPGALETLMRFLHEREDAAGVAPMYLNPDGSPQILYARLPTFGAVLGNVSGLLGRVPSVARLVRRYKMLDEDFSCARPVEQPAASCLLLRRSRLGDGPLLDETFPIYFNDVDLARRLALRGETLWMTPDARVVHELGGSTRNLGTARARHHIGALVRYLSISAPEARGRLLLFRLVVLLEYAGRRMVRHSGALPLRELWRALRGDPGPLPQIASTR